MDGIEESFESFPSDEFCDRFERAELSRELDSSEREPLRASAVFTVVADRKGSCMIL